MDLVIVILWMIYFIPFTVAMRNEHPHYVAILLLNGLLGWTGIGWIAALLWARAVDEPPAEPEPLARRAHLRLLAGGATEESSSATRLANPRR